MIENNETTLKKCAKCQTEKILLEFRKCKTGKFGVHSYCKLCQDLISKESYIKNKEKRLKQILEWSTSHPEQVKEYKRDWYHNTKDTKC